MYACNFPPGICLQELNFAQFYNNALKVVKAELKYGQNICCIAL
jgi:hypothetical protein